MGRLLIVGAGEGPQERQANECLALKSQVGGRVRDGRNWEEQLALLIWPQSASVFVTPSPGPWALL